LGLGEYKDQTPLKTAGHCHWISSQDK